MNYTCGYFAKTTFELYTSSKNDIEANLVNHEKRSFVLTFLSVIYCPNTFGNTAYPPTVQINLVRVGRGS